MKKPDVGQIAGLFGCTPEQVRTQFARNARQLGAMAKRARKMGRTVNGYTAEQLFAMSADALRMSL